MLSFHGELDAGMLVVEVVEELVKVRCAVRPDDKGVVYIAEPE